MARNLGPVEYSEEDTYSAYEATDTPSPGGSTSLEDLTDVDISNPSDGQTLVYNATTEKWENGSGSGGSSTLSGLTDVDLTNPADGQTLVYDAASEKWVNGSASGASAYFVDCTYGLDQDSYVQLTSSKTAAEIRTALESGSIVYIRYIVPATEVAPAFTHVYILDGMNFGTMDDVTAVYFGFMRITTAGSSAMHTQYTMMSDYPVFTESR